jgi:hypothetical protein
MDNRIEDGRDVAFLNFLARTRFGVFGVGPTSWLRWVSRALAIALGVLALIGLIWFLRESWIALQTFGG